MDSKRMSEELQGALDVLDAINDCARALATTNLLRGREIQGLVQRLRGTLSAVHRQTTAGAALPGVELIAAERQRQVEVEGWTPEHDDELHGDGTLLRAAVCYLLWGDSPTPPEGWPWAPEWWKPKDRVRNLVRAGALIAAEIDRLQRAKAGAGGS